MGHRNTRTTRSVSKGLLVRKGFNSGAHQVKSKTVGLDGRGIFDGVPMLLAVIIRTLQALE